MSDPFDHLSREEEIHPVKWMEEADLHTPKLKGYGKDSLLQQPYEFVISLL